MFKFITNVSKRLQVHNISINNQIYRYLVEKSYVSNNAKLTNQDIRIDSEYAHLMDQADRSVIIQHSDRVDQLISLCQTKGEINSFISFHKDAKHYALIEFSTTSSLLRLVSRARYLPIEERVAIPTRHLFFSQKGRFNNRSNNKNNKNNKVIVKQEKKLELNHLDLCNVKNIDEQMQMIQNMLSIGEVEIRRRMFICSTIQQSIRRIFPACTITPFGSTVNGLGRSDGDLDMIMELEPPGSFRNQKSELSEGSLYYVTRKHSSESHAHQRHLLETCAALLRHVLPLVVDVRAILRARVPIVKFKMNGVGREVECDLCVANRTALSMSEMFKEFNKFDDRVLPFMFTVRHWAKCNAITREVAGEQISNFTLSLLAYYFLQRANVLPILNCLKSFKPNKDNKTKGELLKEFFEFYSNFDFENDGISLYSKKGIKKPIISIQSSHEESEIDVKDEEKQANESSTQTSRNTASMFIENPVERNLNVSQNVTEIIIDQFKYSSQNAHKQLLATPSFVPSRLWGVATICQSNLSTQSQYILSEDNRDELNMKIGDIFENK